MIGMATPKRLLVVSNGHGEGTVGRMLVQRVHELAGGQFHAGAFPLVGTGEAYSKAGISVAGPRAELPSGGFLWGTDAIARRIVERFVESAGRSGAVS